MIVATQIVGIGPGSALPGMFVIVQTLFSIDAIAQVDSVPTIFGAGQYNLHGGYVTGINIQRPLFRKAAAAGIFHFPSVAGQLGIRHAGRVIVADDGHQLLLQPGPIKRS